MVMLRSILFVTLLYGSMLVLGILWLPAVLLPRSVTIFGIRLWAKIAVWGMRVICGAKTEFVGLENLPNEPVLIASKHQSMMDTLLPFLILKEPCFILKRELMWYPIFGLYAWKSDMIAIDRAGAVKTLKNMTAQAKTKAHEKRSIVIFPEGTRAAPGTPTDVKPGIALLYRELDIPCMPVAVTTGTCWPAKGVRRYPGTMKMAIGPAIESGLSKKAFMTELKDRLDTSSNELLEHT